MYKVIWLDVTKEDTIVKEKEFTEMKDALILYKTINDSISALKMLCENGILIDDDNFE